AGDQPEADDLVRRPLPALPPGHPGAGLAGGLPGREGRARRARLPRVDRAQGPDRLLGRRHDRGGRSTTAMTVDSGPWIALDVGGANIKAAHESGRARTLPFELWKRPDDLASVLAAFLAT